MTLIAGDSYIDQDTLIVCKSSYQLCTFKEARMYLCLAVVLTLGIWKR